MGEASIKPIETVYNGYRFRSRLEARWAVFFDALNIKYEYEPEGYEMEDGTKYLPDFYLPQLRYYAEVKGYSDHLAGDLWKLSKFCVEKETRAIILSNIPYDENAKGLYIFPVLFYMNDTRFFGYGNGIHSYGAFFRDPGAYGDAIIVDSWSVGQFKERNKCFLENAFRSKNNEDDFKSQLNKEFCRNFIQARPADDEIDSPPFSMREAMPDDFTLIAEAILKARGARFEHGEKGGTTDG